MKVCLVLKGEVREGKGYEEIQSLIQNFDIPLILIDSEYTNKQQTTYWSRVFGLFKGLFNLKLINLVYLEEFIASKVNSKAKKIVSKLTYFQNRRKNLFDEIPELNQSEVLTFDTVKVSKYRHEFPTDIIKKIKDECDVVVLEGFTKILTGEILTATKYGVISTHTSDINKYRGRPHGFFQWIKNESKVGRTVQRLTDDLDGGDIVLIEYIDITDAISWLDVRLRLVELKGNMIARALQKLESPDFVPYKPQDGILTKSSDGNKLPHVIKCLQKNINKRYF